MNNLSQIKDYILKKTLENAEHTVLEKNRNRELVYA